MTRSLIVFGAGVALVLGACGSGESEPAAARGPTSSDSAQATASAAQPAADTAAAKQEALQIFSTRCFTCHGPEGAGDGPGSAGLTPKPRNFQDSEWQASVSDEHLQQIIIYGGAAVGKSPMMPGNPDLAARTAVVAALTQHIRTLSRP